MSLQTNLRNPGASRWLPGALLTGLCITACTVSDDPLQNFVTRTLAQSVAGSAPIAVSDNFLAFPASELGTGPGGTDFNMDTDVNDDVIVTVDLVNDTIVQTGVALDPSVGAEGMAWVNDVLFFVVDEAADTENWNMDGDTTDTVLVYWHAGLTTATYYDTLSETGIYELNGELLYVSETAGAATGDSNLYAAAVPTTGAAPLAPRMIQTSFVDPGTDGIDVVLRGSSNGVLWMTLSEVAEGGNLNGDADMTDPFILALLGTGSTGEIQVVPHALSAADATVEVILDGVDRLVAYYVDEAMQGANLNDPGLFAGLWQPAQCSGVDDVDMLDEVMHWLNLSDFTADPVTNAPVNTGLVGGGQIYSLGSQWLAVVTDESEEGSGLGCDLNSDGDSDDMVLRWVETTTSPAPVADPGHIIAIDTSVAGGSGGVIGLSG
ncbi:MAG: hypothetical protein KDB61_01205, partial [Planctomycetes bacterium]|nr:hypothetical protein [Planctomycetota bacterium]